VPALEGARFDHATGAETARTETRQWAASRASEGGAGRLQKESMNEQLQLSEEMSAETARLRVDVYGSQPREHVLEDLNFLNYRLADVRISPRVTLSEPDIVVNQDGTRPSQATAGGSRSRGHGRPVRSRR